MFDIGTAELVVLAIIALVVVGPKDLPKLMRSVSAFVKKMRGFASEFRSGLQDLADEVEREADPFKEEREKEGLTPDMSPEEITAHIMGNKEEAQSIGAPDTGDVVDTGNMQDKGDEKAPFDTEDKGKKGASDD